MEFEYAVSVRHRMQQELEAYAEWVFDLHHIARLIREAASQGQTEVQVRQERPVDLFDTDGFERLRAKLSERGYAFHFTRASRREMDGRQETGRISQYRELIISWPDSNGLDTSPRE